jgi:protein-S-isoprenylcysteine O-methyltransferase Ste14
LTPTIGAPWRALWPSCSRDHPGGCLLRPYYAGHPLATVLFVGTMGIWFVIELGQALNRRAEATRMDRGSFLVLQLSAVAGALLAALAAATMRVPAFPDSAAVYGLALVVIWAGIGLRWWCFRTLGHYFTFAVMTSRDQPVIITGPYRVLRHPSYAGILLALTGIGLTYDNWLSLAGLVLLPLVALVNRIRVEEAALSATLGAAYTTYASSRKRLVPFVW